jgi:hypothetical protein
MALSWHMVIDWMVVYVCGWGLGQIWFIWSNSLFVVQCPCPCPCLSKFSNTYTLTLLHNIELPEIFRGAILTVGLHQLIVKLHHMLLSNYMIDSGSQNQTRDKSSVRWHAVAAAANKHTVKGELGNRLKETTDLCTLVVGWHKCGSELIFSPAVSCLLDSVYTLVGCWVAAMLSSICSSLSSHFAWINVIFLTW